MSVPKALPTVDWSPPHWPFLVCPREWRKPQAWKRVQTIEKIQSVIHSEWCLILNIGLNTMLSSLSFKTHCFNSFWRRTVYKIFSFKTSGKQHEATCFLKSLNNLPAPHVCQSIVYYLPSCVCQSLVCPPVSVSPLSALHGHQECKQCTGIHAGKAHIYIKYNE